MSEPRFSDHYLGLIRRVANDLVTQFEEAVTLGDEPDTSDLVDTVAYIPKLIDEILQLRRSPQGGRKEGDQDA